MDWTVLGIAPTKDKKAITAAYRARLVQVNPEDKPEEVKQLRAAYEQALQYAAEEEKPAERDESPVGLWMEKVRGVYFNYSARICKNSWAELLMDDVCIALDKRADAEQALLRFLMEDYFLPQEIWQLLDSTFRFTQRREQLYERYPREFIDNAVIAGIQNEPSLSYYLFIPGENAAACDDYRRLYHRANSVEAAEMGAILDQMEALPEQHPYGQALRFRLMLEQGEEQAAADGYRALAEAYPDDDVLLMGWASFCVKREDWQQAEPLYRRVLQQNKNHRSARRGLAECLAQQGNYADAKKELYELMDLAGGDQMALHYLGETLKQWNVQMEQQLRERMEKDPADAEAIVELAWCQLQNDQRKEALETAALVPADYEDSYAYYNLQAKVRYANEMYGPALGMLRKVEEILTAADPADGDEKTRKRVERLHDIVSLQAACYSALGHEEAALAQHERALEIAPDNAENLTNAARMYAWHKNYARAAELTERLTRVMPNAYHGWLLLASNLYMLRRDREAFEAINRALELEGSDLGVYVLKMRILLRNGVWDAAEELITFVKEHGVTDDVSVACCEAILLADRDKDDEKALAAFRAIAARLEAGEEMNLAEDVYYRIAELMGKNMDAGKAEDRAALIEVLDKGLAINDRDMDCLGYKAWLYKRGEENAEALALYTMLELMPDHGLAVERSIAEIYYRDLGKNAAKALEYYRLLISREEHPDYHFYAGTCCRYLQNYAAAAEHFLREQELAPDDIDGYNGLMLVRMCQHRYEDALAEINKLLAIIESREGADPRRYYRAKVRILRRLGRPAEALQLIAETSAKYEFQHAAALRWDICCQFGLWKGAAQALDLWQQEKGAEQDVAANRVWLELYQGNIGKAKRMMLLGKSRYGAENHELLRKQLAELEGDHKAVIAYWEKKLPGSSDRSHGLMNLAVEYRFIGNAEKSRALAAEALAVLDEALAKARSDSAIYRSRRAMVLALLGRVDEAKAELRAVVEGGLCESCAYGDCKDAYIFEAEIEELFGSKERAAALYEKYHRAWPDELDFVSGLARINRKG